MGLVDAGATTSFIDRRFAERCGWRIAPRMGNVRQAIDGSEKKRIGVVENLRLENGSRDIVVTLEAVDLSGNEQLILGLDLFRSLGYELRNVPFTWPAVRNETASIRMAEATREAEAKLPEAEALPEEWREVLSANEALPVSSVCKLEGSELSIETGDNKPIWIRQYPIAEALQRKVEARVQEWVRNGWVRRAPSNCQWNLPLLAAPKPAKEDGGEADVRVCLDARMLNDRITEMPDSNMPLLREVIDKLGDFNFISVLDLADSYHQFRLREQDQVKTAFTNAGVQWMFVVVPFGLKVMTGHMQRLMERLLGPMGITPFQDDVAVASKTREEHIQRMKDVLSKITYEAGLRLRLQKCKFFRKEARVLGSIVATDGIRMDPAKVKAIQAWALPEDGKALQRFMGAVNFHREFSADFARLTAPLEAQRNVKGPITWTPELRKAFDDVKRLFAAEILLRHVDWNKEMFLTTDASLSGIGAWIGQKDELGILRPIICVSKKLSATQQ